MAITTREQLECLRELQREARDNTQMIRFEILGSIIETYERADRIARVLVDAPARRAAA